MLEEADADCLGASVCVFVFGRVGLERDYLLILKHTCAGGCLVGVAAVFSGESGPTVWKSIGFSLLSYANATKH